MTIRTKTIEYAFESRTTNLATATTLAAATFHDFTSTTIYIPETTNRTFKSVQIIFSARDAYTAAYNLVGARVKTTINSVASSNTDYAPTAIGNSTDHETWVWVHDCTADFVANFGTGTSQTVYPSIAISTATAANACHHSARLIITYEYDDGAATQIKTVRIPIQSHHTTCTATAQETGTTGGTANAPANQIPQLTNSGFLPEDSVTVRQAFLDIWCNDGSASTTDLLPEITIDSTLTTLGTIEQALNTGTMWHYIRIHDTATFATTSAHAFKWRDTTTTGRFECIGAVLTVTYEYNEANTTTVCVSTLLYPDEDSPDNSPIFTNGTSSTDLDLYRFTHYVPETASLSFKQSGFVIYAMSAGGVTLNVACDSQTNRPYTLAALTNSGGSCIVHRVDHNSGPSSIAAGKNNFDAKIYAGTAGAVTVTSICMILNYHATKITKTGMHPHTVLWSIAPSNAGTTAYTNLEIATTNQKTPTIPETNYFISNVGVWGTLRAYNATPIVVFMGEIASGEYASDGWMTVLSKSYTADPELCTVFLSGGVTEYFNRHDQTTGKMNIETARKYRNQAIFASWPCVHGLAVTYSTITYSASRTVTGSAGSTVTTALHDATTHEILATSSRSGNGAMTFTWYDTRSVYITGRESSTLIGRSDNFTPS